MVLISNLAEKRAPNYVYVGLTGAKSNRDGLGAIVTVTSTNGSVTKVLDGKSGYLSQSRAPLYFGLGDAGVADRVSVVWPSGVEQTLDGPFASGMHIEVTESTD
jgi:hypothetical protein